MIEEGLWKISAVLLSIVLLFIVPSYLSYERQEDIIYHLAITHVDQLSEKVREIGYLDQAMLNQFLDAMNATGYMYDIEFEHLAKRFSDHGGTIEVYYDGTYTEGIYEVLSRGDRYACHVGDFFFIKVVNTTPTKTAQLRRLLGIRSSGTSIHIKSGGIVRYGDT